MLSIYADVARIVSSHANTASSIYPIFSAHHRFFKKNNLLGFGMDTFSQIFRANIHNICERVLFVFQSPIIHYEVYLILIYLLSDDQWYQPLGRAKFLVEIRKQPSVVEPCLQLTHVFSLLPRTLMVPIPNSISKSWVFPRITTMLTVAAFLDFIWILITSTLRQYCISSTIVSLTSFDHTKLCFALRKEPAYPDFRRNEHSAMST